MTIVVEEDYTVFAKEVVTSDGEPAFYLFGGSHPGDPAPSLTNKGSILVTLHGDGQDIAGLVYDGGGTLFDGALFYNKAGATLQVSALGADDRAYGVYAAYHLADIKNEGEFAVSASNGDAWGIYAGDTFRFGNLADFTVTAGGAAIGVEAPSEFNKIDNSGHFTVTAGGDATGVEMMQGGQFTNSGDLEVSSTGGRAVGVEIASAFAYVMDNSGTVHVTDHAGDSVAFMFDHVNNVEEVFHNSGTVVADYAYLETPLFNPTQNARSTLINTGLIHGVIDLGFGADVIDNTGSIVGDVMLGEGDDSYDGGHGRLKGEVHGADGADTITTGAARDHLFGEVGDDLLSGGKGADLLDGGHDNDVLSGGAGNDSLLGDFGADDLHGDQGDDTLNGGGQSDTLDGGKGSDVLTGGTEADTFVFRSAGDIKHGAPDVITDLESQDVIDLSGLDADATVKGDQAFVLVSAFDGHAGELMLVWDQGAGATFLRMDTNGDGQADLTIQLTGDHADYLNFVL